MVWISYVCSSDLGWRKLRLEQHCVQGKRIRPAVAFGRPVTVSSGAQRRGRPRQLADSEKNGAMARLRNYFLAGVLVTAPVGITFWLTWRVITFVDDRVTRYIPAHWNTETYLPFGIPVLRSAEHPSERQALIRISYADF